MPTSLAGVERVGSWDSLYLGGEGGVRKDVQTVDGLHTPSEHHLRGDGLITARVTDVKQAS